MRPFVAFDRSDRLWYITIGKRRVGCIEGYRAHLSAMLAAQHMVAEPS